MELQRRRDAEYALIGFDIVYILGKKRDDSNLNLLQNLSEGLATIKVINNRLVINNKPIDVISFKIPPDELSIIDDYLKGIESENTKLIVKYRNNTFKDISVRFENEQVRQKSIQEYIASKCDKCVVSSL